MGWELKKNEKSAKIGDDEKTITYDTYGNILNDSNPDFKIPFGYRWTTLEIQT